MPFLKVLPSGSQSSSVLYMLFRVWLKSSYILHPTEWWVLKWFWKISASILDHTPEIILIFPGSFYHWALLAWYLATTSFTVAGKKFEIKKKKKNWPWNMKITKTKHLNYVILWAATQLLIIRELHLICDIDIFWMSYNSNCPPNLKEPGCLNPIFTNCRLVTILYCGSPDVKVYESIT